MAIELPKVSIIIPFKEDRGWLQAAIDSVYLQTYKGQIELIESKADAGVSYNLNRGIKLATGEYIKYLCDDDLLTPNSIEDSVRAMEGNDFIHGLAINRFTSGDKIQKPRIIQPSLADMLESNVIHGGSLMYRKDVFERFGLFDETLRSAEEYDFNMRIMKGGAKLGYCNELLYIYRRHDEQKSLGKGIDQAERAIRINQIKDRFR